MRKQSAKDRINRLNKGGCPVHGCKMIFADEITELCDCQKAEITVGRVAVCPRKNCGIEAIQRHWKGPWKIAAEFAHIMLGEGEAKNG